MEQGQPSKTGEYDNAIMFDLEHHKFVGGFLRKVKGSQEQNDYLMTDTYETLARDFHEAAKKAQVADIRRPVLYSLRHSAVSYEAAEKMRTLDQIKIRGRWRSDSLVARHRKPRLLNAEMNKLPHAIQTKVPRAENHAGEALRGRFSA